MSSISDEIRTWCGGVGTVKDLRALADRIDSEMVELPKSADEKTWTGREVCFWTGAAEGDCHEFHCLAYTDGKWCVEDSNWQRYPAASAWYERPDSWERIADELEAWCDDNRVNGDGEVFERARQLSDRIRKLAKREASDG